MIGTRSQSSKFMQIWHSCVGAWVIISLLVCQASGGPEVAGCERLGIAISCELRQIGLASSCGKRRICLSNFGRKRRMALDSPGKKGIVGREAQKTSQQDTELSQVTTPPPNIPFPSPPPSASIIDPLLRIGMFSNSAQHTWKRVVKHGQRWWKLKLTPEVARLDAVHNNKQYHSMLLKPLAATPNHHIIAILKEWDGLDYIRYINDLSLLRRIKSTIPVRIIGIEISYREAAAAMMLFLMKILDVPELIIDWYDTGVNTHPIALNQFDVLLSDIPNKMAQRLTRANVVYGVGKHWEPFFELVATKYNIYLPSRGRDLLMGLY
ncbi:hypothetical protein NEHOM01_1918 [Nematocida homosporus]|uniref:uncharacterized protein n=1 Tax=Nematocida homosporus TaxID=1912981 RepID=UPI00221E79E8|nr:uncharacterized protein NEHOM01_1918 [Nematocida homosporus]KAI5187085.1 hypothetical protein NEHOM01_1918 [Nematocida homosporus]